MTRRPRSNKADMWRLVYLYPRFVLLSPLFDDSFGRELMLALPG